MAASASVSAAIRKAFIVVVVERDMSAAPDTYHSSRLTHDP
jgi:hypothetical protein